MPPDPTPTSDRLGTPRDEFIRKFALYLNELGPMPSRLDYGLTYDEARLIELLDALGPA